MSTLKKESKNPIFWGLVAIVIGAALLIWGAIKGDCGGGPGCWAGSGALKVAGGALIAGGLIIWAVLSNRKRNG